MGRSNVKFNCATAFIMYEKRLSLPLVNRFDDHCADNLLEVKFSWYVRIQTERMGLLHGSPNENTFVLPQIAVDKNENFREEENVGLPSKSSSMKDSKLYAPFNTHSNVWLVSWFLTLADYYLSLAKRFSFFDVSGVCSSHEIEAPKTPVSAKKSVQNDFQDQNFGIDKGSGRDSPVNFSDFEWSSRNSPGTEESLSSFSSSTHDASPISYSERASYMVSLLNLDGDDWRWDSDYNMDCLQDHDFPSPSSKSTQVLSPHSFSSSEKPHDRSLHHSALSLGNESQTLHTIDLEDVHADEPLFWPFEKKINWCPEDSSTYFPISPRKNLGNTTHLFQTPQSLVGAKFRSPKLEAEKGTRRKLVYGSGSATSKTTKGNQVEKKAARSSKTVPSSRAGESYPEGLKKIPGAQTKDRRVEVEARERQSQVCGNRPSSVKKNLLDTEHSIETLLGLREFDGHEGIDPEFNGDAFSLGDYL